MTDSKAMNWKRLLAEVVAIVFGILLALGLEASWAAHQDRQAEKESLAVLREELAQARRQLEDQLDIYPYLVQSTELIAVGLASSPTNTLMVADSLLAGLLLDPTYDPPTGASSTLLSSGQVELLQSQELRTALAEWPAAIADGIEEQQFLLGLGDGRLQPILHAAVPNLQETYRVLSVWESRRAIVNEGATGESPVSASQDLWNVLFLRLKMLRSAQDDLRNITLAHLIRVEGLVVQEIG